VHLFSNHLARFVVEVIEGLDLRAMSGSYRGSGSASYHPRMLLGILVYGYATGVFSSRKLERATYDSVAFRFIAANDHPDHDTIAAFRRRFLKEIEGLFVQVLLLAREMGVLNIGTIGLDGTKIHANASRHMWTAPSSQEPFAVFGSDRLRPYVRPVGALAHERLAKMVSAARVPNTGATFNGQCRLRSVSRRGSIDHTIGMLSCKFWHRLITVAVELLPVSG
jgi:transposase